MCEAQWVKLVSRNDLYPQHTPWIWRRTQDRVVLMGMRMIHFFVTCTFSSFDVVISGVKLY